MFDPVTWGIWLIGFVILVVWIWMPLREFRQLRRAHEKSAQPRPPSGEGE